MKINKKLNKKSGGYILMGIVSVASFAMLLIVVGISQQSIIGRGNVDKYQDWRIAQTNIFSCISIFRQKIVANDLFEIVNLNGDENLAWKLRHGICEIEILNQTPDFFEFQISSITREKNLIKALVKIEKETAQVLSIK